jgi:hypothetical protein
MVESCERRPLQVDERDLRVAAVDRQHARGAAREEREAVVVREEMTLPGSVTAGGGA